MNNTATAESVAHHQRHDRKHIKTFRVTAPEWVQRGESPTEEQARSLIQRWQRLGFLIYITYPVVLTYPNDSYESREDDVFADDRKLYVCREQVDGALRYEPRFDRGMWYMYAPINR